MYGHGILAVSYSRTVPITDDAKVVVAVIAASHQSANTLIKQCLVLPGVVAEVTMIVVVVEEAASMVDVDVATVLTFPVATHEQTEDTTLLGWPKIATKCQQCTMGFVWYNLPGRSTGSRPPSSWAFLRNRPINGELVCSSLFPKKLGMVPVYRVEVSTWVAVMTLIEVKVATVSTTLKLISMYSDKKRTELYQRCICSSGCCHAGASLKLKINRGSRRSDGWGWSLPMSVAQQSICANRYQN